MADLRTGPRRSTLAPMDDEVSATDAPAGPATTSSPAAAPTPPPTPLAQRLAIAGLLLVGLVGLVVTGVLATTGNDSTSSAAPDSVDRLVPASGAEVLTQATVGIDVAAGYDAYLIINGVEIRSAADGLSKDLGTGRVEFTPGEGKPVTALQPEQNCVVAIVWKQSEGPDRSEPVSWCFDAA